MAKKHKKHGKKHGERHEHDGGGRTGPFPAPLLGIAAMVTHQLQSPAARAAMATGLRAAADALSKSAKLPVPPQPPTPPHAAAAPVPPVPPVEPTRPEGTTRPADPVASAIGEAAELVLARLFGKKG